MSQDANQSRRGATEHSVAVPGGTIYFRTEGSGPPLVLIGGGPSNADTLAALAGHLAADHTVITYDRRGYSHSQLDDPTQPATIAVHADDVRHVLDDLGAGPASVFATTPARRSTRSPRASASPAGARSPARPTGPRSAATTSSSSSGATFPRSASTTWTSTASLP